MMVQSIVDEGNPHVRSRRKIFGEVGMRASQPNTAVEISGDIRSQYRVLQWKCSTGEKGFTVAGTNRERVEGEHS